MALNGWTRLGIVLSTPLCLAAGALQYAADSRFSGYLDWNPAKEARADGLEPPVITVLPLGAPKAKPRIETPQEILNRRFWATARSEMDLSRCVGGAKADLVYGSSYHITCDRIPDVFALLAVALLPAGIVFGLGFIIAWVIRGFRRK